MTTEQLINGRLTLEGGIYTNRASDKGGPTKWGVTMPVLAEWRGHPVTADDVKALARDEAYEVLEHLFVVKSGFLHIANDRVRALMCDWAVNSGIELAVRWLQRTLGGLQVDGKCGPITIGAVNVKDGVVLLKALGHARQTFYVRTALADLDPALVRTTDLANLEGWLNRNWSVAVDPL